MNHKKQSFWFSDKQKFRQVVVSGTSRWAKITSGRLMGRTVCYTQATPVGKRPDTIFNDYYYLGDGYSSHCQ